MFSVSSKFLSNIRCYSAVIHRFKSTSERFARAVEDLKGVTTQPSNDVKLSLYGLYKQATEGKCTASRPGVFDLVGRAKWDAWNKLGSLSQAEAEQQYVTLVEGLKSPLEPTSMELKSAVPDGIVATVQDKVFTIRFNRPDKKNSITSKMYQGIIDLVKEVTEREDVNLLVLTGTGDFFSSGNDLENFLHMAKTGRTIEDLAKDAAELVRAYVSTFIDFPKPMVALVNGPAIGVACTILGIFDVVYASDKAFFQTPFSNLGLSPEGCSSFTFPRIMGNARAGEVLMMNKQLSAEEAKLCGFVSDILPHSSFVDEAEQRVKKMAGLPPNSLMYSKMLLRDVVRADLHAANNRECDRLIERFTSDEALGAVMNFFKGKGKL
uniref:Putative enoyl-coa hydratase/isomerase n=1 Tax=Ornithodoros turicata TaxID=34597 RepID=A0A2R5L3U8_9ACAR